MDSKIVRDDILMMVSGAVMSLLIGVLFFGWHVLTYRSPLFQFIVFGIALSLLITIAKSYPVKTYLLWSALVLILLPLSTRSIQKLNGPFIIRDSIMGVCMIASILMVSPIASNQKRRLIEALVWLMGIVISYLFSSLVLSALFRPSKLLPVIRMNLRIGFLVGVGVSAGIALFQGVTGRYGRGRHT